MTTGALIALLLISVVGAAPQASAAQAPELIAEIRVHGNRLTPAADIVALTGLAVGQAFTVALLDSTRQRLDESGRFDDVQVLKRFASISDASQIIVAIIVDERAASVMPAVVPGEPARVVGRKGPDNLMAMPFLSVEDGYGLTYGGRLALVNAGRKGARLSFPLTWGGERRAAAEYDATFKAGPVSRAQIGTAIVQRTNPAFDASDQRRRVWARAERAFGPVSMGGQAAWEAVSFDATDHRMASVSGDVTLDTRIDPFLARNAVYARAAWTRVQLDSQPAVDRTDLDARAYLGLIGQTLLVARWQHMGANRSLPLFLKPLLGGWSTVRGLRAGTAVGDSLMAGSLEVRMPLTETLSTAKAGISVFIDAGAVADHGDVRLRDRRLGRSVGVGAWVTATAFRFGVSVAHARGADTRVNFGGGFAF